MGAGARFWRNRYIRIDSEREGGFYASKLIDWKEEVNLTLTLRAL
jgi:hypothetical protein